MGELIYSFPEKTRIRRMANEEQNLFLAITRRWRYIFSADFTTVHLCIMCTSVGALKASTEIFNGLKMRSIQRVVRERSGCVYSSSE